MRLVYLDEAGISNLKHEPHIVVAGAIVNPDRQWKDLARYYRDMAMDLFPEEDDPYEFVFEAKHVFHGSDIFEREEWKLPERLKILYRFAQVPHVCELPIAIGFLNRAKFREQELKMRPETSERGIRVAAHVTAFIHAIRSVDAWMEKNAPGEVAMLIAEDTHEVKEALEWIHGGYTFPGDIETDAFLAKNIVDTVHFAKKERSILLQIADHAAFITKRRLMKCPYTKECYRILRDRLIWDSTPLKSRLMSIPINRLVFEPVEG